MKLLYTLIFILIQSNLHSQTTISAGAISGTWQKSGSPYKVSGNVFVPAGQKLSITQGVTVEFQGDYKMDVWGVIQALGKANDTVVFTAKNKTTGWTGLWVHKQASTNDSTLFDHCKFEYRGLQTTGSVPATGSALSIDTARKVRISNCYFTKNRSFNAPAGNFKYSAFLIYNCRLASNEGINKDANIFTGPTSGFQFYRCRLNLKNCWFIGNLSNKPISGFFGSAGALSATDSLSVVSDCDFRNNGPITGNTGAAGIYLSGSTKNSIIDNCNFINNRLALQIQDGAGYTVRNSRIDSCSGSIVISNFGNTLPNAGSTWNLESILIKNSGQLFIGNNRNNNPMNGTIKNLQYRNSDRLEIDIEVTNVDIENSIIANNKNGIGLFESQVTVKNSAIVNNMPPKKDAAADSAASGIWVSDFNKVIVYNSIISGNRNANGIIKNIDVDYESVPGELQLTNCILEGGKSSITNLKSGVITNYSNVIEAAPQFVNPTVGAGPTYDASKADWRPVNTCSVLSNTFNAGTNTISGYTFPAKDADGNTRIANNTVDIGPYEIQKPKIPVVLKDPKDTSICANNTIDYTGLNAVADSLQYRWQLSTNGNTWANIPSQNQAILYNYKPSKAGNEYLRCIVTNPICSKSDTSRTIAVNALILPTPNLGADASIPNSGNKVLNPGIFTAYNWSTGASTPTLTVDKTNLSVGANSISVQVTGSNGCKARDTIVVTLEPANGLLNPSAIGIKIYPVPTSDFLNIEIPQSATTGHFQLSSMDGRILQSGSLQPNFQINVTNLSIGTYFLSMEIDGAWYGVKVVK
ncbi:MAG: T9SS type A sorting domain-containing protein [Bacteroidia bacterium]|nr:T9SS type A sorting domain-containing protein [Bacteroidia bacterium]